MDNSNFVMVENGVSNMIFKGFMEDNAHVNWIAVGLIYDEGDPTLPMVGLGHTCLFHWSQNLDMVTQMYIKTSLQCGIQLLVLP